MRVIRFNVAGSHYAELPTVTTDNPVSAPLVLTGIFESAGRYAVTFPQTSDINGGSTVRYQNGQKTFRIVIPPAGNFELEAGDPLCLPSEYQGDVEKVAIKYDAGWNISDIQIVDDHFEVNGKRWLVRGTDGFVDLAQLLDGQRPQLEAALSQARDLGSRVRRVFGCIKNIRQFNPFSYGEAYYQAIVELFKLYEQYGQYGDFDGLPDVGYWGFNESQCQNLWNRQVATLASIRNKFNVSLTNEYNHGGNIVGDVNDYARPPFALCSQGSANSDDPPPRPGWGIREFHSLKPWPKIFLCEDMMFNREGVNADGSIWGPRKPIYLSECPRFEEGLGETDVRLARTLALESTAFGEGMIFHNEFGKDGRVMGPRTANSCAVAMDLIERVEG